MRNGGLNGVHDLFLAGVGFAYELPSYCGPLAAPRSNG